MLHIIGADNLSLSAVCSVFLYLFIKMKAFGGFVLTYFFKNPRNVSPLFYINNKIGLSPSQLACLYSKDTSNAKTVEMPTNPLTEVHSASKQSDSGIIYDKKPFKMRCEKGKKYAWCLCGRSKNQPLCDGTHKSPYLKITQRPVRFEVAEDKEYWLCNCKQTSNRPFCDGTHKREDIQAAIKF